MMGTATQKTRVFAFHQCAAPGLPTQCPQRHIPIFFSAYLRLFQSRDNGLVLLNETDVEKIIDVQIAVHYILHRLVRLICGASFDGAPEGGADVLGQAKGGPLNRLHLRIEFDALLALHQKVKRQQAQQNAQEKINYQQTPR